MPDKSKLKHGGKSLLISLGFLLFLIVSGAGLTASRNGVETSAGTYSPVVSEGGVLALLLVYLWTLAWPRIYSRHSKLAVGLWGAGFFMVWLGVVVALAAYAKQDVGNILKSFSKFFVVMAVVVGLVIWVSKSITSRKQRN